MKKITWLILFLFTAKIIEAQCIGDMKQADAETNDTLKIRKYRRLLDCYYDKDDYEGADKLLKKTREVIERVIKKTKDSTTYRAHLADLTTFYFFKGDIASCLDVSLKLINYDYRNSDSLLIAASLGNTAILYRKSGNYPKAIYYLQESIKINQVHARVELAGNYANLANVYSDIRQYKKAGWYFHEALRMRTEAKDEKGLALSYANIANHYSNIEKPDSSLYYYSKAIMLNEKLKFPDSKKALTFNNFTNLYIEADQIDSAIKYLHITQKYLNEKSNPFLLAHFYENRGDISQHQKKFKEAIVDYNLSIKYSNLNKDISRLAGLYKAKARCFYYLRDIDSTFENKKLADALKDSLFNASKTSEITRYEMQNQFDKEQEEIKREQLKKELETKNALERKQILIYAALAGLVLLLGLVLIVLKSNNQKKKDNLILQQKNDLIEAQKKDIIDSINYAKNLQQAILPPIKKIKDELGDSFVYYKPKDIIAGDFYWLHKSDDTVLFAVADCTGHGVPGALVSVVCSNALDSSVKEYNLTDPGKILDKTKEIVLETFSKTGQNVKDGMDISLCSIQRHTKEKSSITIKWAGANNSLWYIHKDEIQELTADKQPIGLSENNKPFTTKILELDKGDTLYFSTDGYYDQFGGDKGSASGKKFMRKRLAQLFFEMKDQSMEAQMALIDKTFNSWKGNLEQIDDVCVSGVKL
jgi:serine phosphatase RsbU (regulator of sigma subunit)